MFDSDLILQEREAEMNQSLERLGYKIVHQPNGHTLCFGSGENIEELARIIASEALTESTQAKTAVAWTVRNRMLRSGHTYVKQESHAYSVKQASTIETQRISRGVLTGVTPDNTSGATHFYSPDCMPREGESTHGADVGGGLEQVVGLPYRPYRPAWAAGRQHILISGVQDARFRFYHIPLPHGSQKPSSSAFAESLAEGSKPFLEIAVALGIQIIDVSKLRFEVCKPAKGNGETDRRAYCRGLIWHNGQ